MFCIVLSRIGLGGVAVLLLVATPALTALSRNIAFPVLILVSVIYLAHAVRFRSNATILYEKLFKSIQRHFLIILLGAGTVAYAALSLLWTSQPLRGFGALSQTTSAVLFCLGSVYFLRADAKERHWFDRALFIGIIIGCATVFAEVIFGSPIRQMLGGTQELFRLNRAAVMLALMIPLLFFAKDSWFDIKLKMLILALILLTAFASDSESAKLAAIVLTMSMVFVCLLPAKAMLFGTFGIMLLSLIGAPIIGWAILEAVPMAAYEAIGYTEHLARAEIWWAYAHQIPGALVFGNGLQSSFDAQSLYAGTDPVMDRGLKFNHPHNFAIQVWYEVGAVGVLISSAWLLVLARAASQLSPRDQKTAASLVFGIWCVAYVSHGAWQHWWWAMVAILVIIFVNLTRGNTGRA